MIACIGNIAYDFVVFADNYVEENSKASYTNANTGLGGSACSAACVLSRLGNKVDFYGQVGNDSNGNEVKSRLKEEGLNVEHINISNNIMTPFSFVVVNTNASTRTIHTVRSPQDLSNATIEKVSYESKYDFILTDGKYAENSIDLVKHNKNAISIIDAGRWTDNILKVCENVNYIICSEEFANNVTGIKLDNNYDNHVLVFNKLKERFPNALGITITVGKNGYICEKDNTVINKPAFDSGYPSIDTNCAGDIFHAAFTHALADGYNYYDALEFANITASISTTRKGGKDSCPSLKEIDDAISKGVKTYVKKIR